jgi:hypothetical protein
MRRTLLFIGGLAEIFAWITHETASYLFYNRPELGPTALLVRDVLVVSGIVFILASRLYKAQGNEKKPTI